MNPEDINIEVGKRLALRRRELKLSLAKVSSRCGVSLQQIHKYETGQSPMTVPMLVQLARCLGVPFDYFFEALLNSGEAPSGADQRSPFQGDSGGLPSIEA